MLFFIFLSLLFFKSYSIRTKNSWESIFRSNFREYDYFTLNSYELSFTKSLNNSQKTTFILEYNKKCDSKCHDNTQELLSSSKNKFSTYRIVTPIHGLIFTSFENIQYFKNSHQLTYVVDYIPMLPNLKIDSDLNIEQECQISFHKKVQVNLIIAPLTQEELDYFINTLPPNSNNITYNKHDIDTFLPYQENLLSIFLDCLIASEYIILFSKYHEIQWIEKGYQMKSMLRWANGLVQSGSYQKTTLFQANITGRNQIIGIADSGIDARSCFFNDPNVEVPYNKVNYSHRKIIQYITYQDNKDESSHGTSVCGVAAGKCYTNKKNLYLDSTLYNGAAYDSKISFIDIGKDSSSDVYPPSNYYTNIFGVLYTSGARIMSMSWGSDSNAYTAQARYIDQFMWDYPDTLIIYAAGNSGSRGSNSVGSPATNKNGIAAGASLNDEASWNAQGKVSTKSTPLTKHGLAEFSSRGPTSDGRLKPEICSVGFFTSTAGIIKSDNNNDNNNNNCPIVIEQGTSFAAPILAGYATLVRQYFMDGWYPSGYANLKDSFIPSGSLIKAVLVHGGMPLDYISDGEISTKTTWGDNNQGYGRAQLNNVLSFHRNATLNGLTMFVKGAVSKSSKYYVEFKTGSKPHQYTFRTQNLKKLSPIRITLAYTDYYGTVGATNALINDLDLQLSNSTHVFYPLITNDATNRYDRKNNLEFIILHYPEKNSTYTVTVSAKTILRTQPYSIIITGEVGQYPFTAYETTVSSGLTPLAKLFITIAACVTFCFTLCVIWIGFANPGRREKIRLLYDRYTRN